MARETKEEYEKRILASPLCLRGKASNYIWAMEDVDGYIGLRVDSGDSGTLYMTRHQAFEIIDTLITILRPESTQAEKEQRG